MKTNPDGDAKGAQPEGGDSPENPDHARTGAVSTGAAAACERGKDDPSNRRVLIDVALDAVRGVQAVRDDEEAQLKLEERRAVEEAKEEAERRAELDRIKERLSSLHSALPTAATCGGDGGDRVSSYDGTVASVSGTDGSERSRHSGASGRSRCRPATKERRLGGIYVSESYTEDFSPPRSLVQISIDGGSSEVGDIHIDVEDLQLEEQLNEEGKSHDGSAEGSVHLPLPPAAAAFSSVENVSSRKYPTTLPSTPTRTSRRGSIPSSQNHSHRHPQHYYHGTNLTTAAGSPPQQQQLFPHDHTRSRLNNQRENGKKRRKEKNITDLPFSFEALPTKPPPKHLTGSRRAIRFWAPMTSIRQVSEVFILDVMVFFSLRCSYDGELV